MPDLTSVTKEDLTVRMNIPIADPVQNLSTDNPQEEQIQSDPLSPDPPREDMSNIGIGLPENNPVIQSDNLKVPAKNLGGRPCEYCKRAEEVCKITEEYLTKAGNHDKPIIPYIEELALLLDVDDETISEWASKLKDDGSLEHPGFPATIKRLKMIQRLRLMQRTTGRFNPTGAIFQLKANHGMIETEKRMLVGDKNSEPLEVRIIEEKQHGE